MKISEVPEEYKIYTIHMSDKYEVDIKGSTKENIEKVPNGYIRLENGDILNKAFIIRITLNLEETKDNVLSHADEIKNAITK